MVLPKLTIIIPTLDRSQTLHYTIKTALQQNYDNYEIIVSDNCSNDNTREIVEAFNSLRIKYIKPQTRLSMSKHWEFALDHVDFGFVTILGDDDGILPNKLEIISKLIINHKLDVIGWRFGNFNWQGLPPYFMIPMNNTYRVVNAALEINSIINKESVYNTIKFPSFYGGFINIDLYKKIKEKQNGIFFHSRIPDFFSGAVFAANVSKYIRLEYPISINATSKYSTGFSAINKVEDKFKNAYNDLIKNDNNIPFLSNLKFIKSNAVPIAEAMLQVHKLYPNFKPVSIELLLTEVVNELKLINDEQKFNDIKNGVLEIAALNNLIEFANELLKNITLNTTQNNQSIKHKFSPLTSTLYINTLNKKINTVEDAVTVANLFVAKNVFLSKSKSFQVVFKIYFWLRFKWLVLTSKKHKIIFKL